MLFLGSMSGSSSSEGGERLWSIYLLWCSPGREGLVCARGVNTQAVNAVTFPNDVGGVIESLALFILQKLFRILYSYSYVLQYHGTFLQTVISWSTRKVRYSVFLSTTLNAYGLYTVPAADARTYQYHSSTYSSTSILSHGTIFIYRYGHCNRFYEHVFFSLLFSPRTGMMQGKRACPELLGDTIVREVTQDEAWDVVLDSSKMEVQYRNRLIRK